MATTGMPRVRVLQEGGVLEGEGIVHQTKKDGETAYEQDKFYQTNKKKIMDLSTDRKKLAAYPTKRNVVVVLPKTLRLSTTGAKIKTVTIDDVDSFSKVKRVKTKSYLGDTLSEDEFKQGIAAILGELGTFKDWPGETSDLYSHATMKGKRVKVAFAFKGPAKKGKLAPGMMGKNGDQIQRLFQEDADIYFVQYHGQIDPSVLRQMQPQALARWHTTGKQVYYGVIDGADSERLRLAYPNAPSRKRPS